MDTLWYLFKYKKKTLFSIIGASIILLVLLVLLGLKLTIWSDKEVTEEEVPSDEVGTEGVTEGEDAPNKDDIFSEIEIVKPHEYYMPNTESTIILNDDAVEERTHKSILYKINDKLLEITTKTIAFDSSKGKVVSPTTINSEVKVYYNDTIDASQTLDVIVTGKSKDKVTYSVVERVIVGKDVTYLELVGKDVVYKVPSNVELGNAYGDIQFKGAITGGTKLFVYEDGVVPFEIRNGVEYNNDFIGKPLDESTSGVLKKKIKEITNIIVVE